MVSLPFPPGVVAVAGSRSLPPRASAQVGAVCNALARSGCSLVVGCSVGADAAVLGSAGLAAPGAVRCLAAFGPGGAGACPVSAVAAVSRFAAAGGAVSWWAGGPVSVPLRARLAARTRVVVAQASAGLVVFFASPVSRGSLLAVRCALSRGLPVLAFPLGFPGASLPAVAGEVWVPFGGSGLWRGSWCLAARQGAVFA